MHWVGQPMKICELAKPFNEIMDCIENEMKNEASNQLALLQKLREQLPDLLFRDLSNF
jgi:predicted transcriptional regulator